MKHDKNNNTTTLKEVEGYLIQKEKDLNLFNEALHEIYPWHLIRSNLQSMIHAKLGLIEEITKNGSSTIIEVESSIKFKISRIKTKLINIYRRAKNSKSLKYNPKIKYILIATGIDFKGRDIYCEDIIDAIDKEELFIIDSKKRNPILNSLSMGHIKRKFKIKADFIFSKEEYMRSKFYKMAQAINSDFSIDIELFGLLSSCMKSFFTFQLIYNKLFNIFPNVKKVFAVYISGGKAGLILESRKRNIKIIDIQHGNILSNNLHYNLPKDVKDNHFLPTELYTFSPNSVLCNINPLKQIFFNTPKIIREFLQKDIPRNPKQILFIGQSLVGNFWNLSKGLARSLPDYKIIHLLHPSDIKLKTTIERIKENIPNFEIYNNGDANLYTLLKTSEAVVSKESTVLMQAPLFNNRAFIIDINNDITTLQDFIDIGAFPIKSVEELKTGILSGKGKIIEGQQNRYYQTNTASKLKEIIYQD